MLETCMDICSNHYHLLLLLSSNDYATLCVNRQNDMTPGAEFLSENRAQGRRGHAVRPVRFWPYHFLVAYRYGSGGLFIARVSVMPC